MTDMLHAQEFISSCKQIGLKIALDDFGVGLSSFSSLKYLSIDYLKIDGSFIKHINSSPVDESLVKALVEIAKTLKIQTIAEYVENKNIVEVLQKLNVNYGQGFYFGKPARIEEVLNRWDRLNHVANL